MRSRYTYEIWNKKDPIKGFEADYWLNGNPEFKEGDVVLFKNALGIVERVESANTLKMNYNMEVSLSTVDTIEKYFDIVEEENTRAEKQRVDMEDVSKQLAEIKQLFVAFFEAANLNVPEMLKK